MHVHMRVLVCVHVHMRALVRMHVCELACMRVRMHVLVCVHIQTHKHLHSCSHIWESSTNELVRISVYLLVGFTFFLARMCSKLADRGNWGMVRNRLVCLLQLDPEPHYRLALLLNASGEGDIFFLNCRIGFCDRSELT